MRVGILQKRLLSSSLGSRSMPQVIATETPVHDATCLPLSAPLWSMTTPAGSQEHFVLMIHWYLVLKFPDHEGSLGKMTVTFN